VVAIVAVAIPYSAANSISASRDLARASDLAGALAEVDTADNLQPYAASPKLQRALLLESSGDLTGAAAAAAAAAADEATNWRTWFVLSRIEAYRGRARASVDAYLQARELNPRSLLFARPQAP
jgi:tetratricopeptide (TPR) repeat protein